MQDQRPARAIAVPMSGEYASASLAGNKVLQNTYRLLSMCLGFSALIGATSAALKLPHPGMLLTLGGYFGLLYLTHRNRNSGWGLVSVFALTAFMGCTIGPVLSAFLSLANGPSLVAAALAATSVSFLGLSAYARGRAAPDRSRYGSLLLVGIVTVFVLGLAAIFFQLPALSLAVSAMFVLLMSGLILLQLTGFLFGEEGQ